MTVELEIAGLAEYLLRAACVVAAGALVGIGLRASRHPGAAGTRITVSAFSVAALLVWLVHVS